MKKRLAIVTTHPIQYNAPLFKLLSERGVIDVKVFYTWGNAPSKMYDKKFGLVREWDIPLTEGYEFEMLRNYSLKPDSNHFLGIVNFNLRKKLKKWNPDAVLVYRWSVWSHCILLALFNLKNCHLFFRGDSILQVPKVSFKSKLLDGIKRFIFRKVDTAYYVGERNRQYYEHLGFDTSRLLFAPHSIDNDRFKNQAIEWEERALIERDKMGIGKDDIVFLYAGKFYELKGLFTLIHAFQKLPGNKYKLILAGGGKLESELKQQAVNDQRIRFLGFSNQSEMPLIYRLGNVFVLPSISETWGLSVNEAMACGRPVIVSDACGCAEDLIEEGETGYLFQAGNEKDLKQQLERFTDFNLVAKMGHLALEKINEYSFIQTAISIEQSI